MKKLKLVIALVLCLSVCVQAQDINLAKQEITNLKNLPGQVNNVLNSIKGTNFGPFAISGKCGYDSNWYCFGNCKTWTWWWKFPNFQWLKTSLEGRYKNVSQVASTFQNSFSPIKNWLTRDLPNFTATFKTEMDKLTAAQAVIKKSTSTPAQKEQAKRDIIASITLLNNGLKKGSDEVRSGIQSLSGFNRRMSNSLNSVEQLRQQMESSIARNHADVIDKTNGYPCDRNSARNQATNIENTVRNQFMGVLNNANKFGVNSNKIDQGTSTILATLVNIQNSYQGTLQKLQTAKITPEGAVQELRLMVTYLSWKELSDFAKKELG